MKLFITLLFVLSSFLLLGKPQRQPPETLARADSLIQYYQYEPAKAFISQILRDSSGLSADIRAKLWIRLSGIYMKYGDGESAIEYGLKALAASIKSTDPLTIAEAKVSILHAQQNIGQSLNVPEQTMELFELTKSHDAPFLLRSIHSIQGLHMLQLQDFKQAYQHFSRALQISKKHLSASEVIYDLLILGVSGMPLGKLDTASLLINEARDLAVWSGDSIMLAKSLMTLSFLHLSQGEMTESRALAEKSATLSDALHLPLLAAQATKQQMMACMMDNQFQAAVRLGLDGIHIIDEHPNQIYKADFDSLLYVCYQKLGDSSRALFHFSNYNKSVLLTYEKHKVYQLKQLEYLQEIQSRKLELENQKLLYLSERRKTNGYILLNLFFVTVAFGALSYNILRQRHRRNLYFKEQLISGLMEESEIRSTIYEDALPDRETPNNESESDDAELSENDLFKRRMLFNQLLQLMEKEKAYLNPMMDRNMLIGILGTNRKYLYEAVKFVGNTSLTQILNRYRVFEAKKIIQQHCLAGDQELPEDVYSRAGFAAKSSYYRIFREFTGISPKEYALEFSKNNYRTFDNEPDDVG